LTFPDFSELHGSDRAEVLPYIARIQLDAIGNTGWIQQRNS
jgi:hypothetical protein